MHHCVQVCIDSGLPSTVRHSPTSPVWSSKKRDCCGRSLQWLPWSLSSLPWLSAECPPLTLTIWRYHNTHKSMLPVTSACVYHHIFNHTLLTMAICSFEHLSAPLRQSNSTQTQEESICEAGIPGCLWVLVSHNLCDEVITYVCDMKIIVRR